MEKTGGIWVFFLVALGVSCAGARPLPTARPGAQRDADGRPYFEGRRITASVCHQANTRATNQDGKLQLVRNAQEQGYSGVVGMFCEERGLGGCAGIVCSGVTVRYVVHTGTGDPPTPGHSPSCTPACTGSALCQEGVCVANCAPLCGIDQVCGPDSTCHPAPPAPPIPPQPR